MAYMTMPNMNEDGIDLSKIKALNDMKTITESTDNFTNGEEFEILSGSFTTNSYLAYIYIYMSNLYTTHTYDTNTFVHCCLGVEFNVYIDNVLFQTIQLSYAKSGIPISATDLSSSRTSSNNYYFIAKEVTMSTELNSGTNPQTVHAVTLRTTSARNANNHLFPIAIDFIPQGITNGIVGSYHVGNANMTHIASSDIINYGTLCPMVKINNNIRVTAKYLFFNNNSDSTNEASFGSADFVTYTSILPH